MDKEVLVIGNAIFEFEESGRTSKTAMARFIIGRLNEAGYELKKYDEDDKKKCLHPYNSVIEKEYGKFCNTCGTYIL